MTRARDRIAIGIAVVVLIALTAAVVALVLEAQRRGIETREDLRLDQIRAEAGSFESIVQNGLSNQAQTRGSPGYFTMRPNDPADAEKLSPTSPQARTGILLVDRDGVLVNGSLLRDPDLIGQRIDRAGLDRVLAGESVLLPMDRGFTTTFPAIGLGVPALDADGELVGASISETEVAPDGTLNLFIAEVTGATATVAIVDQEGNVVATRDNAILGKPLVLDAVGDFEPGFHRGGGKVAAVADIPSAGWRMVFLQDIDDFEGDLTGPLQTALLLFLGVVAVGGVIAVVALTRRLQAAREEQRRLEEISAAREEFTSIVSHELRTPVAGLLGFLQTTADHWETMSDEDRRRAVNRAFTNARSLQTLTSDVLDSASIEARTLSYRFASVDLAATVLDAVETLTDAAPDRIVNIAKPSEPVTVRADAIRIRQVLTNLLDNAAKSSPPDSPIDVEIRVDGRFASVSVRDRGAGIAPDEGERIFDKFTRGRAGVIRGTGLGLYISRHIIEAHGGTIAADTPPGEPGARLTFTVPLAAATPT